MSHETRIAALIVVPVGEPIYSEMATTVSISDESGGEFVEVAQSGRLDLGKILIDPQEWPALRRAIDRMIRRCRSKKMPDEDERDMSSHIQMDANPHTTPEAHKAMRAAFEAWCCQRWAGDRCALTIRDDGEYTNGSVQFAWCAWLASVRSERNHA